MTLSEFWDKTCRWLLSSGLRILLIVVLALVAIGVAKWVTRRLFEQLARKDDEARKRADTLAGVVGALVTVTAVVLAVIMVLEELGVAIGPALAAVGIVGVAVGFGSQYLVRDVISGFFILMDNQIRVGDVVDIGKAGLVEKVGLRVTMLRDLSGNVHYVRNGEISIVTNMTKEFSYYMFDIGVAYREDVDEVISVIREVDQGMRQSELKDDILEPIEILGLDKFGDSAIIIKARTKTRPIRQWAVGREFNRRLKKAFDERGIEIPFPHITLYPGQEKSGGAPPLHVAVHNEPAKAEAQ
ncbi:MAG: putative MscS family protein YkuT [Planctomycetes bacterium ADurb.Bin126]|nr:MAG: putative MscS family protein YkuT [Planctomycetes bacterium ADurb.Bin126]HOD82819.1 mechanosensitive ion channel family protein [Phycisphaerae bacterium]HQL74632.1 mechanosensitive ion channel family protein [Phycisphaerae bacterium]